MLLNERENNLKNRNTDHQLNEHIYFKNLGKKNPFENEQNAK